MTATNEATYTLRCYDTEGDRPVLVATTTHVDTGSATDFWSTFWAARREHDGVEAVWDDTVTDWDGDCPAERKDDKRWRREMARERALEAGMLHGAQAYNDELGF